MDTFYVISIIAMGIVSLFAYDIIRCLVHKHKRAANRREFENSEIGKAMDNMKDH